MKMSLQRFETHFGNVIHRSEHFVIYHCMKLLESTVDADLKILSWWYVWEALTSEI